MSCGMPSAISLAGSSRRLAQSKDPTSDDFADAFKEFYGICKQLVKAAGQVDEVPSEDRIACAKNLVHLAVHRKVLRKQVHDCVTKLRLLQNWKSSVDGSAAQHVLTQAGFCGGWDALLGCNAGYADDGEDCKDYDPVSFLFCGEENHERMAELYEVFRQLCRLALAAEEKEERRKELQSTLEQMKKWWTVHAQDVRLHYVFGGLVSSGKTTMINSWLVNSLEGYPNEELLPSDILENTSSVTVLEIIPWETLLTVRHETHRYHELEEGACSGLRRTNSNSEPKKVMQASCETVPELAEKLRGFLSQIQPEAGVVNRTLVQLPFRFVPLLPDKPELKRAWFRRKLWPGEEGSHVHEAPALPARMAPVIVDTPGLDSLFVKQQLAFMLQNSSCVYCFLVDMMKPNAFGSQGFETLKFLVERLHVPFPPVIVFTKWEKFQRQWEDPKFRRMEAKGETAEQLAGRLMDKMFAKLIQARIKVIPYFAAVDSLTALMPIEENLDDSEKKEINQAKYDMSHFMVKLHNLGNRLASPLRNHRASCALIEHTQQVVNIVMRDSEDAKILNQRALTELTDVTAGIKDKFKANVERYFSNIQWTKMGVSIFEPPLPFNRDDCAVSLIPTKVHDALESYKATNPTEKCKANAVLAIANAASKEIQHQILRNMNRLEEDALKEFESKLWEKVGNRKALLSDCQMSIFQRILGIGTMFGGVLGGFTTYAYASYAVSSAAAVSGAVSGAGIGAGAIMCVSMAAIVPIALGAACLVSDQIGWWKWEDCEDKAFEEVLAALKKSQRDIIDTVCNTFEKQVDTMMVKLDEYRIPATAREDTRTAEKVFDDVHREKQNAERAVQELLNVGTDDRWLAGSQELKMVWQVAAKKAFPDKKEAASRA
eukprot:TRINITY_DN5415_c0_g1_i1.p1 TRINITY_DN5415_c0_g1~~TRINITY_DN5415_c0_g1_i1.p1  ORF type:complete len:886 (-),score=161.70 TRINITY_DN5415_c0_g1_i1:99-2756(-)